MTPGNQHKRDKLLCGCAINSGPALHPMKLGAASILITVLVTACTNSLPAYEDLMEAETREELRTRFGEPDRIRSGANFIDVASAGEPPVSSQYPTIEIWEYDSTRQGAPGKAYFWFGANNATGNEILGDRNWVGDNGQSTQLETWFYEPQSRDDK